MASSSNTPPIAPPITAPLESPEDVATLLSPAGQCIYVMCTSNFHQLTSSIINTSKAASYTSPFH